MAEHFSKLKAAIRAAWRRTAKEELSRRGEPADFAEQVDGDGDLTPPDARRVARRAAVLSTVGLRGLASTWPHAEQVDFLPHLQGWFAATGLGDDEAEPGELEVIRAPASELDDRSAVNATWRWEGAAVLAAALGRLTLPGDQQAVDPKVCGDAAGVLADPAELRPQMDAAAFDPAFDPTAFANRMLAVHWRLRQWRAVPGKPVDLITFARGVTWATFNLDGVTLAADGDLDVGGQPISHADDGPLQLMNSVVSERHHAANWLIGWAPIYADVETPT